ncbi:MAG: type IV pilus biogenesis protein PilM [Deltaproteobacteria bacterium]|jgi:hypothetical protein|nr:type IV pilus biogenesis protein PilM [Deltaproteobacteria bacterium]
MKGLAVAGFMLGLIFLWVAILYEPSQKQEQQATASAQTFIIYRNAVNAYALEHKVEGVIPLEALDLPVGLAAGDFHNQVVRESGELRCYVYGQAGPSVVQAVSSLLRGSAAIGRSSQGVLLRDGPDHPLPGFIPSGCVVSVISLH